MKMPPCGSCLFYDTGDPYVTRKFCRKSSLCGFDEFRPKRTFKKKNYTSPITIKQFYLF